MLSLYPTNVGVGGGSERCWVWMEGLVKHGVKPPAFLMCVFKGHGSLLGFKLVISWVCTEL